MIKVSNLSDNMTQILSRTTYPTKKDNSVIYVSDKSYFATFKADVPKQLQLEILKKLEKYS